MAFVSAPPLPFTGSYTTRNQRLHRPARRRTPTAKADWSQHDTFSGFEALCERTQLALCKQTAAADGLGTFELIPDVAPTYNTTSEGKTRTPRARTMRGGRAFESAVISVWRSPLPSSARRRALAQLDEDARVAHATDAVGLSFRLQPRDATAPALRANVHYFQLGMSGATSWWFAGAADLSRGRKAPPNVFARDVRTFLSQCRAPCAKHHASPQEQHAAFLDACLTGSERTDRAAAFAFVVDVVDVLLPAYLPLVSAVDTPTPAAPTRAAQATPPEDSRAQFRERFGLLGGAKCESEVAQSAPLSWWRFTLAPSVKSPEGKRFLRLRNDKAAGRTPPAYM